MRAPLVPTSTRDKAVIAPISNFETWFNNGSPVGSPTFANPIELDLGGRGFRDLIRLSNGTYAIVAGDPGPDAKSTLYKWTGVASDAPIRVNTSADGVLNMEGAVEIKSNGITSLSSIQIISDGGDDILYNDAIEAKSLSDLSLRKFRSDVVNSIDLCMPTKSSVTSSACNSYTWFGTTYTNSGSYTHTLVNAAGCDSIVTLNLTIKQPTTSTNQHSECASYTWFGTNYTNSGSYTHTLVNAAGCDSIVTLNLTIKQPTTSTTQHSECTSYKWFGTDYTTSGVYTDTLVNAAGCDSIVTLNLTIKQPTSSTTEYTTVNPYKWNGTTYNLPGTYTFKTVNAAGCDSVATLQLTFNVFTTVKSTSCNATLGLMTNYIYANSVTGATNYKFKVTNTLTNQVQELQRTSSYFSLSMLASRSYSTPYSVQVAVYKYGRWSPYGDACTINSPLTPSTSVIDAQCNVTLATLTTPIVAKVINGANRYKFEATANGSTVSFTSTSTSFNLTQLAGGAKYATAYSIKVAFSSDNGVTFSDYGATACTITTPAAPLTKITSQCNTTLPTLSTVIVAEKISSANKYKFEVVGNSQTRFIESSSYVFRLTSLLGGAKFGTDYTVRVAYSLDGGVNWSAYGDGCTLTTPSAPLTKLISQCNSVLPTISTVILAEKISGANKYKFEVVGNSQTRFFVSSSYAFRLTSLSGGVSLGTNYTVRVASSFDGGANWTAFGDACTIATPGAPGHVLSSVSPTPISVYPNPFTSTFKVATTFEGLVNVKVMDLTGKLVEQFDVEASELVSKEMGQSYVPGMYQVTVSQDAQIENFKIVKND